MRRLVEGTHNVNGRHGHARNVAAARQLRSRKEAIPTSGPHAVWLWHDAERWRPRLRLSRESAPEILPDDTPSCPSDMPIQLAPPSRFPLPRIPPSFAMIAHRKNPPRGPRPVSRHCCMLPCTRDCPRVPYGRFSAFSTAVCAVLYGGTPPEHLAPSSNACPYTCPFPRITMFRLSLPIHL